MSKNEKKILTQKLLLKLKNLRKPDQSRIKFYNMQPFKTQVLVYFDIEITKIWFSLLSMFSNNWPQEYERLKLIAFHEYQICSLR